MAQTRYYRNPDRPGEIYINDHPLIGAALRRAGWRQFSPWEVIKAVNRRPDEARQKTPPGWTAQQMRSVIDAANKGLRGLWRSVPVTTYHIRYSGQMERGADGKWFLNDIGERRG